MCSRDLEFLPACSARDSRLIVNGDGEKFEQCEQSKQSSVNNIPFNK